MKYEIVPSNQFKKDLKLAQKRGYDLDKIKKVINALANGETLEAKYRDHMLTGDYGGYRECRCDIYMLKKQPAFNRIGCPYICRSASFVVPIGNFFLLFLKISCKASENVL